MEYYIQKKIELISSIENDLLSISDSNRHFKFSEVLKNLEELINILSLNPILKAPNDLFDDIIYFTERPPKVIQLSSFETNTLKNIIPFDFLLKPNYHSYWNDNKQQKLIRVIIGIFCILIKDEYKAHTFLTEAATKYKSETNGNAKNLSLYDDLDVKIFYLKSKLSILPFHERINYANLAIIKPSTFIYYNLFLLLFVSDLEHKNLLIKQYIWILEKAVKMDKEFEYPYIYCLLYAYYREYYDGHIQEYTKYYVNYKDKLDLNWGNYLTTINEQVKFDQECERKQYEFEESQIRADEMRYINDCYDELRNECDGVFYWNID